MTIVSKELDQYKSATHKNKTLSEYIVYLMADNVPVEAYVEYGHFSKEQRIQEIRKHHNVLEITTQYLIAPHE